MVAGLFAGLSGVGGGPMVVPLLTGYLRLNQHRAQGTALAIILVVAIAAALPYWSFGITDWRLASVLAAGSVVGSIVGARVAGRLPAAQLRRLFGGFLLAVALIMFVA